MDISGKCSLIIRGLDLNFEDIEKNIKINPSRIVKKGQFLSKVIGKSEYDIWVFEKKFTEEEIPNQALEEILSDLYPYKLYIKKLSKYVDVRIKCYVQSKYAQINYEFAPKVIIDLADMGIIFEISILSWGEVNT